MGVKVENVEKVVGASVASLSMDNGNGGVVGDEQVLADVGDAIVLEGAMQGVSVEKASEQLASAVVRDTGVSEEDMRLRLPHW